jgi:hypothetical protein
VWNRLLAPPCLNAPRQLEAAIVEALRDGSIIDEFTALDPDCDGIMSIENFHSVLVRVSFKGCRGRRGGGGQGQGVWQTNG